MEHCLTVILLCFMEHCLTQEAVGASPASSLLGRLVQGIGHQAWATQGCYFTLFYGTLSDQPQPQVQTCLF